MGIADVNKPYRIETHPPLGDPEAAAAHRHGELMRAIGSLSEFGAAVSATVDGQREREIGEALALRRELESISGAIAETKREIATLHYAGAKGREIARVTDELGAIVSGTEAATNDILAAAEAIDGIAGNLTARLTGDDAVLAQELVEHTVKIFESCNFQDITGQRAAKVVNAMRFIEERVAHMMEVWGGMEIFKDVELLEIPDHMGDAALLNGPALEVDEATDQDAIDALFG